MFEDKKKGYPKEILAEIALSWGLRMAAVKENLVPEGSPERTAFRVVVEDMQKGLFVLEQIPPASYHKKTKIIETLAFLAQNKMSKIVPYLADKEGRYIREHHQGFWQMMPFAKGVALDRETYFYEGWRAPLLAQFLIELKAKSAGMPFFESEKVFSLWNYIDTLVRQIERHRPEVMPRVKKVIDFLERKFVAAYARLPTGFCHGDFHPLNIIWEKQDIQAVIDWEFLGIKPEIYDAVNMVGCLGMEHPSSLVNDLVLGFIRELREAGIFSALSWKYFLEFVIALRFAWLSEWLRKEDGEMIALELDYMELLIGKQEQLRKEWRINA